MRYARWMAAGAVALALVSGSPTDGTAQVWVRVDATWEWSTGPDGRYHEPRYDDRYDRYDRYDRRYDRRRPRYRPVYGIRVPPGHRPPPGLCRVWFPGRPPGHQPPPRPCGALFRYGVPVDAVIVGPGYRNGRPAGPPRPRRGNGRRPGGR
ncbi:MAG: hypothetical protein PVI57_12210 [Gemmatimonadota bacterium]|jgi:hypothetical protein